MAKIVRNRLSVALGLGSFNIRLALGRRPHIRRCSASPLCSMKRSSRCAAERDRRAPRRPPEDEPQRLALLRLPGELVGLVAAQEVELGGAVGDGALDGLRHQHVADRDTCRTRRRSHSGSNRRAARAGNNRTRRASHRRGASDEAAASRVARTCAPLRGGTPACARRRTRPRRRAAASARCAGETAPPSPPDIFASLATSYSARNCLAT